MKKFLSSKKIKSAVALILVFSLVFAMAGCAKDEKPTSGNNNSTNNTSTNTDTTNNEATADAASYTFNDYMGKTPQKWNPHEWEMDTEDYVRSLTTTPLYGYKFNENKDGYMTFPEAASDEPIDITAELSGDPKWGIPAGEKEGWAFKIPLEQDLKWEDGTLINADTYIYSMQQLLNPEMKNYRASAFYSGMLSLVNAELYYKQNQDIYTDVYKDGAYREVVDSDMKFSFKKTVAFFENSAKNQYDGGSVDQFMDGTTDLYKKYSEKDYYDLNDEAKSDLLKIAAAFGDNNAEAYKEFCFTYDGKTENMPWENVGMYKTGDYEIAIVLAKPITDFYLKYNLNNAFLVHEETYEKFKTTTGDITKTTYGTSAETYKSYGPYKLTEFQIDKQLTFDKSENWFGYNNEKYEGQYQTTRVNIQIIPTQVTALQLFLQGKIDAVALTAADMDTYRSSDNIKFTPNSYTSKFTFNSDKAALKARESAGINKTILSYKDFRQAFSLAIDREEFAAQCFATHQAGLGLFNYMYIYDPETGEAYRNSDEGKNVFTKMYGTDNVDEITGYDKDKASQLFTKAYNDALSAGDIKDGDKVELEYLVFNSDEIYVKTINFVQESINAATAGTPLEGKVTVKMTPDENYYDRSKQGLFEIITSTWGGNSMDPFSIVECYTVEGTFFEYGFKPDVEKLTIEVNGKSVTRTFSEWNTELMDGEYAAADPKTKLQILAGIELGILETYNCAPLYYRTNANLRSHQINDASSEYILLMGFGGISYYTYNYTDAEWEQYCKDNNNQLSY